MRALFALFLLCLAVPVGAQEQGGARQPILTIDADRLYEASLFGARVEREVTEAEEALAAENRRIEEELRIEEQSLTDRRPAMDPAAFRAEARAFDERVQRIRTEQDAKELAIGRIRGEAQRQFLQAAGPILGAIMRERGASVILERRSVFGSLDAIDVTEAALARIDIELGEGLPDEAETADDTEGAPEPAQ